jgi:hypothetical protein
MRRTTLAALAAALGLMISSPTLTAETLEIGTTPVAGSPSALPMRGASMTEVENRFGAPERRVSAVGQPPISRWVYADFVVYFEYSHVVHAVRKNSADRG